MSYSTLSAPSDLLGLKPSLHSHRFAVDADRRRDSDSHSPIMSEPHSPLFRASFPAELPPHLASIYNSPYAAAAVAAAVAGQANGGLPPSTFPTYGRAPGPTPFYPGMLGNEGWRRSPYLSQLELCWPQNFRSLDTIVGPRTKAPREATSILKSWLNEHKDNPYPTKSEKMTLSIVTHMTLTQVSTWFANARRRIKKENKMTWIPKTRCGERDGSSSNEEENEKDNLRQERSPFSGGRDADDDEVRRSSGDLDPRREHHLSDGTSSSSRSFSPETSHKSVNNQAVFSALHRLHPQFYSAAAAAAAASLLNNQGHIRRQNFHSRSPTNHPTRRLSGGNDGSPPERKSLDGPPSLVPDNQRKMDRDVLDRDDESPPSMVRGFMRRSTCEARQKMNPNSDEIPRSRKAFSPEVKSPFVQLRQATPVKQESLSEDSEHTPLGLSKPEKPELCYNSAGGSDEDSIAKREVIDGPPSFPRSRIPLDKNYKQPSQGRMDEQEIPPKATPFSSTSDVENKTTLPRTPSSAGRHFDEIRRDRHEENLPMSPDDREIIKPACSPQSPGKSTYLFDKYESRESTTSAGGQDALSSWIRDFQQLVSSGQEQKAKQALATALAAAAKAGAYSGRGPRMTSPYYHPEHFKPSDKRKPMCSPSDPFLRPGQHSPMISPGSFYFPPFEGGRYERRMRSEDSGSLSSDTSRRDGSTSTDMSPTMNQLRSPHTISRLSPDNAPINLSKTPSSVEDWKRPGIADDQARMEA